MVPPPSGVGGGGGGLGGRRAVVVVGGGGRKKPPPSAAAATGGTMTALSRVVPLVTAFLLGCAVCTVTLTMMLAHHQDHDGSHGGGIMRSDGGTTLPGPMIRPPPPPGVGGRDDTSGGGHPAMRGRTTNGDDDSTAAIPPSSSGSGTSSSSSSSSLLRGTRIMVAIASYDFSQLPHLEEVLDSYRDVCEAGAIVHLTVHTTQPYPVSLIDMLNSRLHCLDTDGDYRITISLKSPSVKLHLVDYHRTLFYDNLDAGYDLFLYSEDDIRVTPTTIASYLSETRRIQSLLLSVPESDPSDYNVGVVRYEYDYPPDLVINDATRHATERVTRVYWEHLGKPVIPGSIDLLTSTDSYPKSIPKQLQGKYVTMTNHHQGMYMATPSLLRSWRTRGPTCKFDVIRDRPGMKRRPSQPTEGTQRVWMSSHMLHGARHCGVRQILPIDRFGELTVHHLPNKNYRRVGKKGRLGGGTKENDFGDGRGGDAMLLGDMPDESLVGEMELHVELRKNFPSSFVGGAGGTTGEYGGVIRMVDEIDPNSGFFRGKREHDELVRERMMRYREYVARGGVMSDVDVADAERDLEERRRQRGGGQGRGVG